MPFFRSQSGNFPLKEAKFMKKSKDLPAPRMAHTFVISRLANRNDGKSISWIWNEAAGQMSPAKTRSSSILSRSSWSWYWPTWAGPLPLCAEDNNNKVASPGAVGQQLRSSGFCWHFCFGPGHGPPVHFVSWIRMWMWKPKQNAQLASNLN